MPITPNSVIRTCLTSYGQKPFDMLMKTGHSMISILPDGSYTRWKAHQRLSRVMHHTRSKDLGIPVVVGFFIKGFAEEISLFGDEHEHVRDGNIMYSGWQPDRPVANLFRSDCRIIRVSKDTSLSDMRVASATDGIGELIIGKGCADKAYDIAAQFNHFVPHNWGWSDRMGDHISFYDPPYYVRESVSGRHVYTLKIEEDKSVTLSSFEDYLEARCLEPLSPPWKVQMEFAKSIGDWQDEETS